ncbi:hypothetical protein [Paenibacillus sp. S02]|uniref:hypothetical protein n=1 Tax=Paenibacillus sp. S02 TaxID=2823904 RepID=UPI001C64A3B1|nr:hypothetical protein [Paenibacillus sp. S02]QYK68296.1 hypothetical protein KAI36_03447 [Paenibacillus sp. S02]
MSLTREQVLGMELGVDLDAMVAEFVFGWTRITGPTQDYHGPVEHGDVLIPPNTSTDEALRMMPPKGSIPFTYFVNRHWSKSISAAWKVEENMLLKHPGVQTRYVWRLRLVTGWEDKQPAFREDFKLIHATPEERCKAALLAVLNL